MHMRSHVDPCTFVAFIHVPGAQLDEDFASALRAFDPQQGDSPVELLSRLPDRSHQIRFHEDYHYWQGLRLPFLYRYALLSMRQAFGAFRQLAAHDRDYANWDCVLPEFERLGLDERIGRYSSHLVWGGSEADFPDEVEEEIRLRPLDLLECATSMAEFQVSAHGDKSDPVVLRRWAKRNPGYFEPYEFAARFLGDPSVALRCILPLINASFQTSEPVRSFVELLARMYGAFVPADAGASAFLAQPEPCRWAELFANWLDELPYEAQPDSDGRILGSPYHRLTLDHWVKGAIVAPDGGFLIHPFLGLQARKWIDEQVAKPEYGLLMDHPASVRHETFWECRNEFSPILTVYRFHLGDAVDRTLFTGVANGSAFTSLALRDAGEWRGFVADFLTIYGAVRRASGAHFDTAQRTCGHVECPQYAGNFCNMYPIIPNDYAACGFPDRIARLINTLGA